MRKLSSEDGAILMHVILAMVLLIGINTFVIDYGVMWVGRGQAQNAADAGALGGAVAMAFDDYNDRTVTGPAKLSAWETSRQNYIWSAAPKVDINSDVTFPTVPANPCADNSCIRVDVYRNVAAGNPLPVVFGAALGLTNQGVRAMAIARAAAANASDCLKPWAIPDKWNDVHDVPQDGTWNAGDTFEITSGNGNNVTPLPDPDIYVAPSSDGTSNGTGFDLRNDNGLPVTLKFGSPGASPAPGYFLPIDLPLGTGKPEVGGANYRANIAGCNGVPMEAGALLDIESGNMVGPTKQGVDALIALDPYAVWNSTTKKVDGSCAQASPSCGARSPRIVAIPVYDTLKFEQGKQTGKTVVEIVRILGFFIDKMQGNDVVGYFTTVPGLLVGGAPTVNVNAAFAKVVQLVR